MSFVTLWNHSPRRSWAVAPWENEFDRLFTQTFAGAAPEAVAFAPAVDVEETDTQYRVHLDVPGVKKEDIQIEVLDHHLHVSGERKFEKATKTVSERAFGKFERVWSLPKDVDPEKVEAAYAEGVLTVTLNKAEAAKPRLIKVTDAKAV